ncbi:MAG: sigma 54-interacting transcriptional regulator [candidate division Zixibacteria bacterium]|nr:sigma 54-interacting transcriptional regulator [candidate division Zixibacteria bacterium]
MSADQNKTDYTAQGSLDRIELLISERKLDEAAKELEEFRVENAPNPDSTDSGWILFLSAKVLHAKADYETALDLALKSFDILRFSTENKKIGKVQLILSRIYASLGDLDNSESYARDALATFRRIRDRVGIFSCYNRLAWVLQVRGDYEKAAKYLKEAIESFRSHAATNEKAAISLTRYSANLARIYILTGQWDEAADLLESCIEKNRLYNVKRSLVINLLSLGYLSTLRRNQRQAWYCLEEVKHLIGQDRQYQREAIILKEYLGKYYIEFGEFDKAISALNSGIEEAESIAPESALSSQLHRYRSEAHLAIGEYGKSLDDAEKALRVARQIGEKVEIANALRVLGIARIRLDQLDAGVEYLRKSEETFSGLADKFDRALALLDFACESFVHDSEYEYRRAQAHIVTARFVFDDMDARFYTAESWMIESGLHAKFGNFDLALKAIEEAEEMFGALGETEKTKIVRSMRREFEKKLVDSSLSPHNEFLLFKTYLSDSEYKNVRQGTLEENLDVLARRTNADHAFVAIFDSEKKFRVLVSIKYSDERMSKTCSLLSADQIRELEGRPVFATAPDFAGVNGLSPFMTSFPEATSLILFPLRISDHEIGLLLLQKDVASLGGRFFGQRDLDFAVAFSDVIAFKAMEAEQSELAEDNRRLRQQLEEKCAFPNVITRDAEMLRMLDRVVQVKDSPISILVVGDTGCGKDLIAKTIHYNSIRAAKRFISVNCAALPETLLESELFGYKRGAFTGADRDKAGLFEEADGGTFFLDEIGEMPLSIQVKLLRVLEDQEVVRLGETSGRKVDVRVLSATNRDLKTAMEDGTFRQDLYYRLSALTLKIPPLRDRRDDIPLLIEHFLSEAERKITISPEAFNKLVEYSWPGNVRELENEIKKLVLLCDSDGIVETSLLSRKFFKMADQAEGPEVPNLDLSSEGFSLYEYLGDFERKFLVKALQENKWVKKHAATALKIPESTLRLKMKQYDIRKS